jgi:hypothetical protein
MASEYFYIIGFIDSNGSHVTHKGIVIREYEEKMSDLFDRVSATYPSYSSCVSWSCTPNVVDNDGEEYVWILTWVYQDVSHTKTGEIKIYSGMLRKDVLDTIMKKLDIHPKTMIMYWSLEKNEM